MEQQGIVHGEYAKKYHGYTYRKPIFPEVDIFVLDPYRINPTTEYPRIVDKPSATELKTIELADYLITVSPRQSDMWHEVKVFMMPNKYTQAKEKKIVCEFEVANAYVLTDLIFDEALKRAFN